MRHFDEPGHAHELTFSCYKRLPLLSKDRTRDWLIEAINRARAAAPFQLWAYVIMPEHVHILLYPLTAACGVADILKSVKQSVSRRALSWLRAESPQWMEHLKIPTRDGKSEYRFWQAGPGYDRNIDNPHSAWKVVDYLHENPVRRGLVPKAIDWP